MQQDTYRGSVCLLGNEPSKGTSHRQQTDAKDREETEGGDDAGRWREETCRPVQRTGKKTAIYFSSSSDSQ